MKGYIKTGLFLLIYLFCLSFVNAYTNWSFWGYVQNSSYNVIGGANVSIYNFSTTGNGPPSELYMASAVTNFDGFFNITNIETYTGSIAYRLKIVWKNYSSGNVSEVGPILPPMPYFAMQDIVASNSTFYTQPAATLRLNATNSSGGGINFGYMVQDKKLGFPIAENIKSNASIVDVYVPRNRNYTIMFLRDPSIFGQDAVPPMTYDINNASANAWNTSEYIIIVQKNLSYDMVYLSGYINLTGNTSAVRVNKITTKLMASDFVPPNSAISIEAVRINNSDSAVASGWIAFYNATVMGSSSGINYMVEFYGNGTNEYYAQFQNISITGNTQFNITLTKSAGSYSADTNTTQTEIRLYNSDNSSTGMEVQDAHAELSIKFARGDTLRYMLDDWTSATGYRFANMSFLNNSNVTIRIYNNQFAPLEKKLDLTQNTINIYLKKFGIEKRIAGGAKTNYTGDEKSSMNIKFYKNTLACNAPLPPDASCLVGSSMNANFNPMKAAMAGKVNFMINSSGTIIYYIGADLIASGPPDAMISENAIGDSTNSTTASQLFRFGSMGPKIYDSVYVGFQYNESKFDETQWINITISSLYDNDGNKLWNTTANPTGAGIPSDWSDYNTRWFNRSAGGMPCSDIAPTSLTNCSINKTTNYLWLNLPHFTDDELNPQSPTDSTPPTTNASLTSVADYDSDGNIELNWTDDITEIYAHNMTIKYRIFRYSSKVNSSTISSATLIINTTTNGTGINSTMGFWEDNQTQSGTTYWYGLVTIDAYNNFNDSVVSVSLNATANDTIKPKSPVNFNSTLSTSSSSTSNVANLRWSNLTLDINGNSDGYGLRYIVYYATTINTSKAELNKTDFTLAANATTNSTSFSCTTCTTATVYHFVVVSADDAGNENLTLNAAAGGNYLNATLQYTAPSSSSSSSSSGGGGGGAAITTSATISTSHSWATLPVGETSMTVAKTGIDVTEIVMTVANAVANAEITVSKLGSAPASVSAAPAGTLYQYIEISKKNIQAADLTSAKVKFKVPLAWLTQNNGKVGDVVMRRYTTSWEDLPTKWLSSDAANAYYEAITPGFSYFAISLKPVTTGVAEETKEEVTTPPAEEKKEEVVTQPEKTLKEKVMAYKGWLGWVVVAAIIIVGLIVYFASTKKKKE